MPHIYHKINFSAIIPALLFADNKPEGYFTLKEAPLDKWEEKTNAAWEAIIARVKKLWDGGMTQSAIAKKLGLSQASVVNMWLSGQRKAANTSAAALFNYLEKLGFDPLSFFEEGDGQPIIHRLGPNAPVEEVKGHDLPTVPVLGTTGAGDPQELFSEKPEFMLEVLPPYAHKGSIALRVEGDSMEPNHKKGSLRWRHPGRRRYHRRRHLSCVYPAFWPRSQKSSDPYDRRARAIFGQHCISATEGSS